MPVGIILEGFWCHAKLRIRLGSCFQAVFVSEVDFLTSTHPILDAFTDLLAKFFGNCYRYGSRSGFVDDFSIVFL